MRHLYTLIFYLSLPFVLARLYWKGRAFPLYRQRIAERFFLQRLKPAPVDVWLHAASFGEAVAATPLIEALLAERQRVCITTITPTGSRYVQQRFDSRVEHQYIPYDLPWALRRFFRHIKPKVVIIMETELWPNLITLVKKANIRLFLANGRISDKAFHQYKPMAFFFRPLLKNFTAILAQSEDDAERFRYLGGKTVHMVGNMKFDITQQMPDTHIAIALQARWGATRPILLAASTHADEEMQLLTRLSLLQQAIPTIILLIAPRHPERFQTVYALSQECGLATGLRSQPETLKPDCSVVVLDSMGELMQFYAISQLAFVGGSLVPVGGHNVLEPIALNVPTFCGPHMQNSKAICAELVAHEALYCAKDADDLIRTLITTYQDPERSARQAANAKRVLQKNQGTVNKHLSYFLYTSR